MTAWVNLEARATRGRKGWAITELRTGNRDWTNIDALATALNEQKRLQARVDLSSMAAALEKFHRDRGYYVVSESHAALIDHLIPKYLLPVLRLDPWGQPYVYEGARTQYTLASAGPDRKAKTTDDITVTNASR